MCGIFVAFSKNRQSLDLQKCRSVLEKLSHRGPDFSFDSMQLDGSLYMGQTILSITGRPDDLFENYQVSKSKRFNLVLNGEIYNFKQLKADYLEQVTCDTGSDAEVLVNLYDALDASELSSKLRGMYAYCVFDRATNKLYVSRDLIGEKCIYLYEDDEVMLFSSETSAILEYLGRFELNNNTLCSYFYTRHLLTPYQTLFEGITALPVGNSVEISLETFSRKKIHEEALGDLISAGRYEELAQRSDDELVEELDALFKDNAAMMAPEIRYASIFSGGIDSSIASWYMLKESSPQPPLLVTLQFGDKDFVSKQVGLFEERLGSAVIASDITVETYSSAMQRFYEEYQTMMATHSFVSQMILSDMVNQHGCKVVIGGDGADELFGGYEYYKRFSSLQSVPDENPSPYSGFVDSEISFPHYDKEEFRESKRREWNEALEKFGHLDGAREKTFQAMLYLDSLIELETVGMRSSDLMSMANSVESRSFFVSREVLEFAINLPVAHKLDFSADNGLMMTKPLLKKLFVKLFGEELLFEKQGYSGHPNEAAMKLLGNSDYSHSIKQLGLDDSMLAHIKENRSLEWKIMNTELFLNEINK